MSITREIYEGFQRGWPAGQNRRPKPIIVGIESQEREKRA